MSDKDICPICAGWGEGKFMPEGYLGAYEFGSCEGCDGTGFKPIRVTREKLSKSKFNKIMSEVIRVFEKGARK